MKIIKWVILSISPFLFVKILLVCVITTTMNNLQSAIFANNKGDASDMTCTYLDETIKFDERTEKVRKRVENEVSPYYINMILGIYQIDTNSKIDDVIKTMNKYINNNNLDVPTMIQVYKYGDEYLKYLRDNNVMHTLSTSRKFFESKYETAHADDNKDIYSFYVKVLQITNKSCKELSITGDWVAPLRLPYTITNDFGGDHRGIDLSQEFGSDVFTVAKAEVLSTNDNSCGADDGYLGNMCPYGAFQGAGNYVELKVLTEDNKELFIYYFHLEKTTVNKGDIIDEGQIIGKIGNSGNSTGTHLHLEIRDKQGLVWKPNGHEINPHSLINFYK